jgi:hypothetical protein
MTSLEKQLKALPGRSQRDSAIGLRSSQDRKTSGLPSIEYGLNYVERQESYDRIVCPGASTGAATAQVQICTFMLVRIAY